MYSPDRTFDREAEARELPPQTVDRQGICLQFEQQRGFLTVMSHVTCDVADPFREFTVAPDDDFVPPDGPITAMPVPLRIQAPCLGVLRSTFGGPSEGGFWRCLGRGESLVQCSWSDRGGRGPVVIAPLPAPLPVLQEPPAAEPAAPATQAKLPKLLEDLLPKGPLWVPERPADPAPKRPQPPADGAAA
eukprot:EG_transcript_30329